MESAVFSIRLNICGSAALTSWTKAGGHSTSQECGAAGATGALEEQKPFAALSLRLAFLCNFQLPRAAEVGRLLAGCVENNMFNKCS